MRCRRRRSFVRSFVRSLVRSLVQVDHEQLQAETDQLRVDNRKLQRVSERQEATAKALAASKAEEAQWLAREKEMEHELAELKESCVALSLSLSLVMLCCFLVSLSLSLRCSLARSCATVR